MPRERRNLSSLGRKRRRDFDRSAKWLRDLGLPPWAIEYYGRAARVAGVIPHMVVCQVAMIAAGRELSKHAGHIPPELHEPTPHQAGEGEGGPGQTAPSYETIRARRRRISSLWREIQRHESTVIAVLDGADAAANPGAVEPVPDKHPYLPGAPAGNGHANARARRRAKASSKHH